MLCNPSLDGFSLGNWRALHHHAVYWLVNIHITWHFCPPCRLLCLKTWTLVEHCVTSLPLPSVWRLNSPGRFLFTWKNDSVGSRMLSVSIGAGLTSTHPLAWTGVLSYLWASTKIWLRANCGSRPVSSSTPLLGLPSFSSSQRLSRDTRWGAIGLIVLWSPSVMFWLHSKCNRYNYKLL